MIPSTPRRALRPRLPGPGSASALAMALVGLLLSWGEARAQDAACEFQEGTQSFNMITLSGGGTITYLGRPRIGCPDGVRIVADSAVSYSAQDMTHLIGSVLFRDGARELRAREARYFPSTGRLQASGDVRLEDREDGSVVENGDLVLLRETEFRERSELTVTVSPDGRRPQATLFLRPGPDTTAVADPPADTLEAPDTTAAPPAGDTAAAPPASDTVAAPPAADTTAVPAALDTAAAPQAPDTAAAPPAGDSAAAPSAADTTVAPPAPDTTPPTPFQVVGNRLFFEGDRYFEATGDVEIDRDSLHATGQRAEYDEAVGYLVLQEGARVDGSAYDLEGEEIELQLDGGDVGQVTARRRALLLGEDLRLEAPVIHLFLEDELLDRLVAVPLRPVEGEAEPDSAGLARPVATAESFRIVADSLDVRAPGQQLDRIWAVGGARGVSMGRDSLNVEALPEVARNDWIEGDTILATFRRPGDAAAQGAGPRAEDVGLAVPDTLPADSGSSDEYVLDRLVASGSARSLYRLLPSDSTARAGVDPPAVHYVLGSRITIAMAEGEVESMEVEGPTDGFHLEPLRRGSSPPDTAADTLSAPDSAPGLEPAVVPPPDTVAAPGAVGATPSPAAPPGPATSRAPREAHLIPSRGRWVP